MCHQSPAKLLRSIKRITSFLEKKKHCLSTPIMESLSPLSLYHLPSVDIPPFPPKCLSITSLSPIDIPPTIGKLPKLTIVKSSSTSFLPRPVYHPAIYNASQHFFLKPPSQLTADEAHRFKQYQQDKTEIGEPLEAEEKFLPIGGIRTCVNCGELTWISETLFGFSLLHILEFFPHNTLPHH